MTSVIITGALGTEQIWVINRIFVLTAQGKVLQGVALFVGLPQGAVDVPFGTELVVLPCRFINS